MAASVSQDEHHSLWYQFLLPNDPRPHGFLLPWVVEKMPWTSDFTINHEKPRTVQLLDSSSGTATAEVCNAALESVVLKAIEQRIFKGFDRAANERFRILGSTHRLYINRTAAPIFGVAVRGVHMIVYQGCGADMKIWVPRRASTLFSYPNALDSAVAGGVREDESPFETIIHEADEEASLSRQFVRDNARSCGALTFMSLTDAPTGYESGLLVPEVIYAYELQIPKYMDLQPNDREVGRYDLMSIDQVTQSLQARQLKPSSSAALVDFLIRHGFITDDNEPNYLQVISELHQPLPVPVSISGRD